MATTVKFSRTVLLLAVMLLAGIVTSVQAQTTIEFCFDENGHSSFGTCSSTIPVTGSLLPDPTNPGQTALTYMLPAIFGLVPNGDLGFTEPGGGLSLSEVVRFTDGAGNLTGVTADRFIFYSELETPPSDSDLADHIGIPANARGATIIDSECPLCGTIGFHRFNGTQRQNFDGLSDVDVVPEPSSFLLLGTGLLGIVGYGRRKWNCLRQS